jgi:DNA-binding FadR family transcriptional regulator
MNSAASNPQVVLSSELLRYLALHAAESDDRAPAIHDLARLLAISPGKLREQLEVARELGLVDVRPKTGIRRRSYSFGSSLRTSIRYALAVDPGYFEQIGELRNHLEVAYWHQAVRLLLPEDKLHLEGLIDGAWRKLRGQPIQIPHAEHRELHLRTYARLTNEFVRGILEAYWDAYEAVGLNVYADYAYLQMVWGFHERMVKAIVQNEFDAGYQVLIEHAGLLLDRPELDHLRERETQDDGHDSTIHDHRRLAR